MPIKAIEYISIGNAITANNKFGARASNIAIARSAIEDHVKATGIAAGIMDCPVCKVCKLKYSQAMGYSDHIHAICLTFNIFRERNNNAYTF